MGKKIYLGDGVFVERGEGWQQDDNRILHTMILTTSDGTRDTNRIVLEPDLLQRLVRFFTGVDQYGS